MKKLVLLSVMVANIALFALKLTAAATHAEFRSLDKKPVLTQDGIKTVAKTKVNEAIRIQVSLNEAGTKSLQEFSSKHSGEPLVIMLGDKVLSTPIIRGPLVGNSFEVSGLSEAEADQLLNALRP